MAKVGLDAICAKLSRNAEMTSTDVDGCLPVQTNNDDAEVPDDIAEKFTERRRVTAAGSASLPPAGYVDVVNHRDLVVTGNGLVSLNAVDRAPSLVDSGYSEEAELDGDFVDDVGVADAGRRSRRKNFLPRCVQDGMVVVDRASDPRQSSGAAAASTTTTTWSAAAVENVEDGQAVLDLSTGRGSARQNSDSSAVCTRKSIDNRQDQILDLSVPRCARGPLGESTVAGRASPNSTADMRLYAVNAMTELLHIYGLPDDQQSSVTDLRKWVPPADNGSVTGTSTLSPVDLRPTHVDVSASSGRMHDREQVMTTSLSGRHGQGSVTGQMTGCTTELARVKGTFYDAYTPRP